MTKHQRKANYIEKSKNIAKDKTEHTKKFINNTTNDFKKTKWTPKLLFITLYETLWNIILFLFIISSLLVIFVTGIGIGYFASLVQDENVMEKDQLKTNLTEMTSSTSVSFMTGENLGTLKSDVIRNPVKYNEISPNIVKALITTEDENFYDHNGIVPKAFLRALGQQAVGSEATTGGSTITQQLIKNQILTNETTFSRKAKELLIAQRVEKIMSKEEILEAYLNAVSFGRNSNGQNVAGVEATAKGLFNKSAKEVNIAEAAFIAGLPKNPYAYTPFTNTGEVKDPKYLKYGKQRQEFVLSRMLSEGVITKEEHDKAVQYKIFDHLTDEVTIPNSKYPYLTQEIERRAIQILKEKFAREDNIPIEDLRSVARINDKYTIKANDALRNNGYQIKTTIHKEIYDEMQQFTKNDNYYLENKDGDMHQISMIMKENNSGKILSFIGGRNFEHSQNNFATQTSRPVGSTMKPHVIYAPAIESGLIVPETYLFDRKFKYESIDWSPANYDADKEFGFLTTKTALENSYNLSALRLYQSIKSNNPWQYLEKTGVPVDKAAKTAHSLPLGPNNMTLEDNVNAFSVYGNKGQHNDGYMIESITSSNGDIVYQHKSDPKKVYSESTSYLMTDMMKEVLINGSAYKLNGKISKSIQWAGKTGTSQNTKDIWFVAYNPKITLGVWSGYPNQEEMPFGADNQLNMWRDVVNKLTETHPKVIGINEKFNKPSTIKSKEICPFSMAEKKDCLPNEKSVKANISEHTKLSKKSNDDDASILSRFGIKVYEGDEDRIKQFKKEVNPKNVDKQVGQFETKESSN